MYRYWWYRYRKSGVGQNQHIGNHYLIPLKCVFCFHTDCRYSTVVTGHVELVYFCRRYYPLFVGTLKNHHPSSGTLVKFYWFIVWLKADWPAVSVCNGSWSATDHKWLQRVMTTGQHITGLPIKPEEQIFTPELLWAILHACSPLRLKAVIFIHLSCIFLCACRYLDLLLLFQAALRCLVLVHVKWQSLISVIWLRTNSKSVWSCTSKTNPCKCLISSAIHLCQQTVCVQ